MTDEKDRIMFACKKCGKKMDLIDFRKNNGVCKKCRMLISDAQQK